MQKTWGPSLGWEDPLEEEMATYSSILAWKTPRTEPSGLQSMKSQSWTQLSDFTTLHFFIVYTDWASQETPVVKNLPANAGEVRDAGLIPGSRIRWGGNGTPLQYFCLKNPMD